jgi:hypothetical protein
LYVFTYKIVLFSYCRLFTNSFPFSNRRKSQCSTLGATQFLFVFESQASRAGAVPPTGRPRSWKRRGILKWGIDVCCGAWREEQALPGHLQTELISRRDVNIKMGRFGSRAGAGKPRSRKRRGISHWRIDECCGAPREEHGDIRLLENGKELVKRRQY